MTDDRTEPATPKRRKKAREEGQVARSAELVTCVILLAVLSFAPGLGPGLARGVTEYCLAAFAAAGRGASAEAGLGQLASGGLVQVALAAGPILGIVCLGAVASNVLQVGLYFHPGLLQPKLSRVEPLQGLKRLCTGRSLFELAKGIAKLLIVGVSGWAFFQANWERLFLLPATEPGQIAPVVGQLAHGMAFRMTATLTVLAALDYAYQRWQFERSLRMTKQEVRDEIKEAEGDPALKAQIRRQQRAMAQRRMMADVARASVVVTNPTHYAVALLYEPGASGAPKVVAKGRDLLALRIREIAQENRVPTVEDPPLARSLYGTVEIGQEIPPELYRAVAEVLALVWRLAGRREEG